MFENVTVRAESGRKDLKVARVESIEKKAGINRVTVLRCGGCKQANQFPFHHCYLKAHSFNTHSSQMKEVVTIQLGAEANFIASHHWNLLKQVTDARNSDEQADVNADPSVFFRYSSKHCTHVPRTVIVDTPENYGALSYQHGQFMAPASVDEQRPANAEAFEQERILPHSLSYGHDGNDKTRDSNIVRYWSDYLSTPLHNRTCHTAIVEEELFDDIRYQVEDCDSLSGIVIVCGEQYTQSLTELMPRLNDDVLASTTVPKFVSTARGINAKQDVFADAQFVHDVCVQGEERCLQYIPLCLPGDGDKSTDADTLYKSCSGVGLALFNTLLPLFSISMHSLTDLIRSNAHNFHSSLYYGAHDSNDLTNLSHVYELDDNMSRSSTSSETLNANNSLFISKGYDIKHTAHFRKRIRYTSGVKLHKSFPLRAVADDDVLPVLSALENSARKTHATLHLLQGALDPRKRRGVPRAQLEDMREALLSCSEDVF